MCNICHGKGKTYDYNNSAIMVLPCPDEDCRKDALERSDRAIERIKAELKEQREVTA